jgi:hypothetical protein
MTPQETPEVWTYNPNTKKWLRVARSDDRFNWSWPHAPDGMVRFVTRRSRANSDAWHYVYFGASAEEAAARANRYGLNKIAELEMSIAELEMSIANLRQAMVQPPIARTLFTCRVCDTSIGGRTDGSFDTDLAGPWARIEAIDGPNAICPACQKRPDALEDLIADGYPNARIVR